MTDVIDRQCELAQRAEDSLGDMVEALKEYAVIGEPSRVGRDVRTWLATMLRTRLGNLCPSAHQFASTNARESLKDMARQAPSRGR